MSYCRLLWRRFLWKQWYCTLVLGFFIIVGRCSAETCKINLMLQCIGCLLCSVAEIEQFHCWALSPRLLSALFLIASSTLLATKSIPCSMDTVHRMVRTIDHGKQTFVAFSAFSKAFNYDKGGRIFSRVGSLPDLWILMWDTASFSDHIHAPVKKANNAQN